MTKKEKKRVPELRFPGFEGEWEKKKVKDLFLINAQTSPFSILLLSAKVQKQMDSAKWRYNWTLELTKLLICKNISINWNNVMIYLLLLLQTN